MSRARSLAMLAGLALAGTAAGEELCENGTFSQPGDPLAGWHTDYRWLKNRHYMANHYKVTVLAQQGGYRQVLRIVGGGDAGAKVESNLIPLEQGYRYTCTMDVKGGPFRLYFSGYKWKPGIRPHDKPELYELRRIYKSKATKAGGDRWQTVSFDLPGVELSDTAWRHLKHVRFLTVYAWTTGEGYIDNVSVTRTEDDSLTTP